MKTHKVSKCQSCGAEIIWAMTQTNKRTLVDAKPVPNGNIYLVHRGPDQPPLAVHAKFSRPVGEVPKYRSHFASCRDRHKWRGKSRAQVAKEKAAAPDSGQGKLPI